MLLSLEKKMVTKAENFLTGTKLPPTLLVKMVKIDGVSNVATIRQFRAKSVGLCVYPISQRKIPKTSLQ